MQLEVELAEEGCSKTGALGNDAGGSRPGGLRDGDAGSVSMWCCAIRRIGGPRKFDYEALLIEEFRPRC